MSASLFAVQMLNGLQLGVLLFLVAKLKPVQHLHCKKACAHG